MTTGCLHYSVQLRLYLNLVHTESESEQIMCDTDMYKASIR